MNSCYLTIDDILEGINNPDESDFSELGDEDDDGIPTNEMLRVSAVFDSVNPEYVPEDTEFWRVDDDFTPEIHPFVQLPEDEHEEVLALLQYFRSFVTCEMLELCIKQTNIYRIQKLGTTIDIALAEMEQLLGIYLRIGLAQSHFQKLVDLLHFQDIQKEDKLQKIRPWLTLFSQTCLRKVPEQNQYVDEIMIPFKRCSSLQQYKQKKSTQLGFKMWARGCSSGYLYDFDVYKGAASKATRHVTGKGLGYNVVMKLTAVLEENPFFRVYADNFFTS
ncbi:piggyBac transposable element-derived protein 3-like [Schistocerca gregaria]|uniref:piggyBac transposable element-derived protein 3-like n=1 Tax=Schistocerca gregaria TaxID=7010 RepID=UPI00211DBE14|nr:piggyBac transposable element-derived protein 3-like [Schistocerca gregaria]